MFQRVVAQDGWGNQLVQNLHSIRLKGKTSLVSPNLQVGSLCKGPNGTKDFSTYIGGRQFAVVGKFVPRKRIQSERITSSISVGTSSFTHLVSFKRRNDSRGVAAQNHGFQVNTDTAIWLQARINASLSSTTFNPPSDQIADEYATDQAVAGNATYSDPSGVLVKQAFVPANKKNALDAATNLSDLFVDIPDQGTISWVAQAVDSNGSVTFGLGSVEERW
jgi:hypothetical protein